MDKVLVALVEDEPVTRERLQDLLIASPVLELAFSASTASSMLAWLHAPTPRAPDVLLVDLGLPDGSGIDIIAKANQWHPKTDCMVITMFGDESSMISAFEAGAKGYLLKSDNQDTLAELVLQLREGGSPMSPIIARQLLTRMATNKIQPAANAQPQPAISRNPANNLDTSKNTSNLLTTREYEILQYISRGYTYPELARYLGIGQTTVLTHVRNIYAKLSVHSKTEAVYEARYLGLLS